MPDHRGPGLDAALVVPALQHVLHLQPKRGREAAQVDALVKGNQAGVVPADELRKAGPAQLPPPQPMGRTQPGVSLRPQRAEADPAGLRRLARMDRWLLAQPCLHRGLAGLAPGPVVARAQAQPPPPVTAARYPARQQEPPPAQPGMGRADDLPALPLALPAPPPPAPIPRPPS